MLKKIGVSEVLLIILLFVFGMAFAIPLILFYAAFFILPAMLIISKKYKLWLPLALYTVFSLLTFFFNFNAIIIFAYPAVAGIFLTVYFIINRKNYLFGAAVTGAAAILIITATLLGFCLFSSTRNPVDPITDYIKGGGNDIILVTLARINLSGTTEQDGVDINLSNIEVSKTPNSDTLKALEQLAFTVEFDIGSYVFLYVFQYALLLGLTAFFALYLATPLKAPDPEAIKKAGEEEFLPKNIAVAQLVPPTDYRQSVSMLTVPKDLLFFGYLPLLILSWILAGTIMSDVFSILWAGICIVPFAFAGLSLVFYLSDYIEAPVAHKIVKVLLSALFGLCFFFDLALFIWSLFGIADCFLNTRKVLAAI